MQSVYIVKMGFDCENSKIASVVVGPKLPINRNYEDVLLCPIKSMPYLKQCQNSYSLLDFDKYEHLNQALPHSYTPGFMHLVRLVDELRILKQVSELKWIENELINTFYSYHLSS